MPTPVPGFVTAGDALRKALAENGTLTERLIAYRDSLGNAESKALIADALDELSLAPWRESRLLEALKPFADAARHLHPSHPDDGTTLDGIEVRQWRKAADVYALAQRRRA